MEGLALQVQTRHELIEPVAVQDIGLFDFSRDSFQVPARDVEQLTHDPGRVGQLAQHDLVRPVAQDLHAHHQMLLVEG
ncbi:MAG TPA: hypothetical protein EYQ60_09170, partial [Myxococcales bacterium]|nr:hypothetical protein [Myxococcales bacterium]